MASEVVSLTRELIAQPSVNPQDRTAFTSPYGEQAVADLVFDWLRRQNLNPQLQTVRPHRPNVIATAPGRDTSRTLLLTAHLDTVDTQNMTHDPFDPIVRDHKIFGRGSCDDKGPLAALMIAFRDRVRQNNLPCNLTLLATCGEEYDLLGARYYARHLDTTLIGGVFAEPTDLDIVVAHKGIVRLRLQTTGRAAHSSTPDLGDNAIYHMLAPLTAVRDFADRLHHRTPHPLLGCETLTLTVIHGGQQINIIPDQCTALLDWRILPHRQPAACRDELAAALPDTDPPASLDLVGDYIPMQTDPDHPFVHALRRAASAHDLSDKLAGRAYATDAGAFTHLNIPTLVLGPGSADQAHTAHEFITIDQLENALDFYTTFLDNDWPL